MRTLLLWILGFLALAWSVGCDDSITQRDLDRQEENISDAKQKVESEENQLAAMKDRQLIQSKMETDLEALDKSIDALEEIAEKAEGDRQVEIKQEIAGLRTQYEQMQRKLDELKAASGDAWASAKIAAEDSWKDLRDAVNKSGDKWGGGK